MPKKPQAKKPLPRPRSLPALALAERRARGSGGAGPHLNRAQGLRKGVIRKPKHPSRSEEEG